MAPRAFPRMTDQTCRPAVRWLSFASLCLALTAPLGACKGTGDTANPDDDSESDADGDPLAELQAIPGEIQAELDLVLQPITDVDVVIDQVATMPTRLGVDAVELSALVKASVDSNSVTVELDLDTDAKAEIESLLQTVNGIAVGLKQTPERAKDAGVKIVKLATKATTLSAKLTAKLTAKLKNPMLKGDAKAAVQADLDSVTELDASIKAFIGDANSTVSELPAKGTEAMAKLTTALGGAE